VSIVIRRQAIEPIIGLFKSDHGLDRCYLKGQMGEAMNALRRSVGHITKLLIRVNLKKGVRPFLYPFLDQELRGLFERLRQAVGRFQVILVNLGPRLA
jgi:hypothetical protein